MILLGYVLPNGDEIDLINYPSFSGSVHLDYANDFIRSLKENNLEEYERWKTYAWNYTYSRTKSSSSPQCDFLLSVLGWIKVGNYSAPEKLLTYAYSPDTVLIDRIRRESVEAYESSGYQIRDFFAKVDMEEKPPMDYEP